MTISGNAAVIRALMDQVKGEKVPFDFDKIIPMPSSLMIESSMRVENGRALLAYREGRDDSLLRKMMEHPWVKKDGIKTVEALAVVLEKRDAEGKERWAKMDPKDPFRDPTYLTDVELARTVEANKKEHGYETWYDWSYDHWGTKWNAYDQDTDPELVKVGDRWAVTYEFTTAWASPTPVLEALATKYPVKITVDVSGEIDQPYSYGLGVEQGAPT